MRCSDINKNLINSSSMQTICSYQLINGCIIVWFSHHGEGEEVNFMTTKVSSLFLYFLVVVFEIAFEVWQDYLNWKPINI